MKNIILSTLTVGFFLLMGCSNTEKPETNNITGKNIGVGSIKSITLGNVDDALAEKGKDIFKANCSSCHKFTKRYIGPALLGITERREPEWIMNMIMNPEKMTAEDDTAKALLAKYIAPMANQQISEEKARAILEYFRIRDINK